MKVNTSSSIMSNPDKITNKISGFWNQISSGWKQVWGPHIHHGFYENKEPLSPIAAQEKLIDKLASLLDLKPHQKVLDVGCGMGGSSIYLAKHYQINATGITISPKQLEIAKHDAKQFPELNLNFKIEDAHSLASFSDNEFDVVWSLESCEQFYDKKLFIEQVCRILKPGGKFMLATWCSDQEIYENKLARNYIKICESFDLPYMPTLEHYSNLLKNNFSIKAKLDWSSHVKKSWELGISEVKKYSLFTLFKLVGIQGLKFAFKIKLIRNAFNTGRMRYGVFVSVKN